MSETTTRLLHKFQDEEYRIAYDEEFANSRIAMQIQVIRESQDLTQKELAGLADMKQSRISELENVNYQAWTVSTLRRIATALGVRFFFGFESWGELLEEVETSDRSHLVRPRFEKDPIFRRKRQPYTPRPLDEIHQSFQQRLFLDSNSLLEGGRKDTEQVAQRATIIDFSSAKQDRGPSYLEALAQPRKVA